MARVGSEAWYEDHPDAPTRAEADREAAEMVDQHVIRPRDGMCLKCGATNIGPGTPCYANGVIEFTDNHGNVVGRHAVR